MISTVIAIDDEAPNLLLLEAYLDGQPYEMKAFESAYAALEYVQSGGAADAVLLDRMMPGMDGMSFIRELKALPRYAAVPVIMQTAAATPAEITESFAAGAYYYLTKPYSRETLQTVIKRALFDYSFHRSMENTGAQIKAATSRIDDVTLSFRTLGDIGEISSLLALAYPDPQSALLGIRELMVNAVEHGNLGITYDEKTNLVRRATWEKEFERRLALPENTHKFATVRLERNTSALVLTIEDSGDGFDWTRYIDFDVARARDPNGRGISMARIVSFDDIAYISPGNKVVCRKAV